MPQNKLLLDTLGYIAFLQNDYEAAAEALGKAYELSHNINIGIRYAKALLYARIINSVQCRVTTTETKARK